MDYEIKPIKRNETYEWLLKIHYAKRIPSIMFAFGLYNKDGLNGVCVYGMPPCQFNYGSGIFKNYKIDTFELTRLVVKENLGKNVLSFFVSQTLKQMKKPSCIVSFADPNNGHHGYIYQATNWIYTGLTQKGGKDKQWILNNREYHAKTITVDWMKNNKFEYDDNKNMTWNWIKNGGTVEENTLRKFRYLYFLGNRKECKEMKNSLNLPILPYPKGNNERYEINSDIKITEQLSLI